MVAFSREQFRQAGALIDDGDNNWSADRLMVNGERKSTGLIRRDYGADPQYSVAEPFPDSLLLDEHDLREAFAQQQANHSTFHDLRLRVNGALDSLDQNGKSLCWCFSTTKATMYIDGIQGNTIHKKSAWFLAGILNQWQDHGGWGSKSLAQVVKAGIPLYDLCPTFQRPSGAAMDACMNDGAKRKVTRWYEGASDKDKATHQMLTAFALGTMCPILDLQWMSHSMCGMWVPHFQSFDDFEVDTDNSWGMKAGIEGMYKLVNGKAKPDGLVIAVATQALAA